MKKILASLRREKARLLDKHYINKFKVGNVYHYFIIEGFLPRFQEDVQKWNERQKKRLMSSTKLRKKAKLRESGKSCRLKESFLIGKNSTFPLETNLNLLTI